jgi:hypothetical protein
MNTIDTTPLVSSGILFQGDHHWGKTLDAQDMCTSPIYYR